MFLHMLRGGGLLLFALLGFLFPPFGLPAGVGLALGAGVAAVLISLDLAMGKAEFRRILGTTLGLAVGLGLALLLSRALAPVVLPGTTGKVALLFAVAALVYLGGVAGYRRGERFSPQQIWDLWRDRGHRPNYKIVDTSTIIDGRIADICETGFLDGVLVVPQFVLKELQFIADSADAQRRNRGRKGLDILQKLKKGNDTPVEISEVDFPDVREVDLKLIELAKMMGGKIMTNDLNLNKVASLRGVQVLNINELANALRPVVLPGETLKVFLVKEGKEREQAVGYLDDGTMVVVDDGRRIIGRKVEVLVTSVLQTTAGKMIFARYESSGAGRSGDGGRRGR